MFLVRMLGSVLLNKGSYRSRLLQVNIGAKKLITPTYFPSISSIAIRLPLEPLLHTIIKSGYPRLLVSSYDLAHLPTESYKRVSAQLSKFQSKNNFLFLDSGSFESYWLQDKKWNFNKYKIFTNKTTSDFFTSFDDIPNLHDDYKDIVKQTYQNLTKSDRLTKKNHCITICHGNTPEQISSLVKKLVSDKSTFSRFIAIPERNCGKTIFDKMKTIQKIRQILDEDNPASILHILGCGNPVAIALFVMSGADSFDSIDWSRWTLDLKTLEFTDFAHLPLIGCNCKVCRMPEMDSTIRVLLHNLLFYQEFIQELQQAIIYKSELKFLKKYLDPKTISKIVNFL